MKSSGNEHRAPLRTVLQNFLNHVETLERRRNGSDDQYEKEFQDLKILSESLKGLPAFSCSEGEKEVNRRKNRYKDILPFDCTRVSLSEIVGIPGSDYINANYIRGASGSQAYIASQGPLAHTVTDFWRMVVECDVQVIVMACNEEESGKHKCECYWSENDTEPKAYGPYSVKLLKSRRMCNDFNLRTMELTYTNASGESVTRTVVQFHYWAWPDHGVPALVRPLLDMVRLIRDCQASETLPLLIHCSAGCGRTGTICAIDYVWGLLRAGKLTEDFSLYELIADMRRQRVAMVQTKDQYILVHRALRELFIEQLKMIDAHPYENLDVNGHPLICPENSKIDPSYETIFVKVNSEDSSVLEVNEEEDVVCKEEEEMIPWPVLQFQSSSEMVTQQDSAPPLPDKKRRTNNDSSSGQASPVSPTSGVKSGKSSSYDNVSDGSNSKESTPSPPPSPKDNPKTSAGLVRKSSILKIRAFFEKSPSAEPREKSKSRKSSSFRLREAPAKFYRTLEPAKLSLPPEELKTEAYNKPSLPVKRSKSMKVYRGFDVHSDSVTVTSTATVDIHPDREIVLSKPPSITYITSREKLFPPPEEGSPSSALPLGTSSLDRGVRDQRIISTSPTATGGGSLDRSVVTQSKVVPTYVNVLIRNQEAACHSRLDEDTRQLLQDCQAYLMYDDVKTEKKSKLRPSTLVDPSRNPGSSHSRQNSGTEEPPQESSGLNRAKKPHEYEAIWLSPSQSPRNPEEEEDQQSPVVMVQKTDEIRLLLTELRNPIQKEESARQQSSSSPCVSPRLHPDRVLSELQELVERANRTKEEAIHIRPPSPNLNPNPESTFTSIISPMPYKPPAVVSEPKAPAFRPPPPYPTNKLYVKLPPLEEPPSQRRIPPEYKAPPPVKKMLPVAPPRAKRSQTQTASHLTPAVSFPKGPPIPTRSFVPLVAAPPPGIDVDAVAAVMAASASESSRSTTQNNNNNSGSSSPTTAANKALSKALGKFHATAASFKTKLVTQFGDTRSGDESSPTSAQPPSSKIEKESNNSVRPTVVYVGEGVTVVSTSEATSYVRKKQQYL